LFGSSITSADVPTAICSVAGLGGCSGGSWRFAGPADSASEHQLTDVQFTRIHDDLRNLIAMLEIVLARGLAPMPPD
jgi:hypothetical protein